MEKFLENNYEWTKPTKLTFTPEEKRQFVTAQSIIQQMLDEGKTEPGMIKLNSVLEKVFPGIDVKSKSNRVRVGRERRRFFPGLRKLGTSGMSESK